MPKSCIFSFNLSKNKEFGDVRRLFWSSKLVPLPPKTKSRVSDDFSQNIKTASTGGRRIKKPANPV